MMSYDNGHYICAHTHTVCLFLLFDDWGAFTKCTTAAVNNASAQHCGAFTRPIRPYSSAIRNQKGKIRLRNKIACILRSWMADFFFFFAKDYIPFAAFPAIYFNILPHFYLFPLYRFPSERIFVRTKRDRPNTWSTLRIDCAFGACVFVVSPPLCLRLNRFV